MAFIANNLRPIGRNSTTGATIWFYQNAADSIAAILTDGYFENLLTGLAVGDVIIAEGSDSVAIRAVLVVGGTTPFPVTLNGTSGGGAIAAADVSVDAGGVADAGGTAPSPNVQAYLNYLATRINLKVQNFQNIADGGFSLLAGLDTTDPTNRLLQFRRLVAGTGIEISNVIENDTIVALQISATADGGGPPPNPTPPSDNRSNQFGTGTRRLHVSPSSAAPLDGSTPDSSFTDLNTALQAIQAGDVLTIGAGDYFTAGDGPFTIANKGNAAGDPIWIAEEQLGTVRILRVKEAAFNGTQAWTNQGGGRFSAAIGDTYLGVHNGDFLPKYSSIGNLNATSVNGRNKPRYGLAFSGGNLHIKLRNNQNPNGQSIILPRTASGAVLQFNNCDRIIWDGCEIIGGGERGGIQFDQNSAFPVIRHVRTGTSRFLCACPSDSIVTFCDYALADPDGGGKLWMRETIAANSNLRAAFFPIIKGDLAEGGNALYEGGIAVGAGGFNSGAVHEDCEFSFNRHVGVFDGERFGEFRTSTTHDNVYDEVGDDCIQFEDDRNNNEGNGSSAFRNRMRNPHGPVFSHQNVAAATHNVYRNLIEITEPNIFAPEFMIKLIRTNDSSTIRYYQNYFEHFGSAGSRNIWYPFSTPVASGRTSGGKRISLFINNIVTMPGGVSSNSGGVPSTIGDNAVVGPGSTSIYEGVNGINTGGQKSSLLLDSEFVPQSGSPVISLGRALPGGLPADPTTISGGRESGVFESTEDPGPDYPRSFDLQFDLTIPPRWTSPGP